MNTDDIFICKQCGIPIRNSAERAVSASFTCETCDVCRTINTTDIDGLKKTMLKMIWNIIARLYEFRHGQPPSQQFRNAIRKKLEGEGHTAEAQIESIKKAIAAGGTDLRMWQQVAASEKVLGGFFYMSGNRRALMHSPTILRHWLALVKVMDSLLLEYRNLTEKHCTMPEFVLRRLGGDRYDLSLVRLSKLVGDNPVIIIRDPDFYERNPIHPEKNETRAEHLVGDKQKHLIDLVNHTEMKNIGPRISNDWRSILRYSGNACLITELSEVIEFRAPENNYLCKYIVKDEVIVIVDDLWFLKTPNSEPWTTQLEECWKTSDSPSLAAVVTTYPGKEAEEVVEELQRRRYVPNCVDVTELVRLSREVERELNGSN